MHHDWIGGDPLSTADDPCGVQGSITAIGDTEGTMTFPAAGASPCEGYGSACCITGKTKVDTTYVAWGAALQIALNSRGGQLAPYTGPAKGFIVTLEGDLGGDSIYFAYPSSAEQSASLMPHSLPRALNYMMTGTAQVMFSQASCPNWATKCVATASPVALVIAVQGSELSTSFSLCVTSITPVF